MPRLKVCIKSKLLEIEKKMIKKIMQVGTNSVVG